MKSGKSPRRVGRMVDSKYPPKDRMPKLVHNPALGTPCEKCGKPLMGGWFCMDCDIRKMEGSR